MRSSSSTPPACTPTAPALPQPLPASASRCRRRRCRASVTRRRSPRRRRSSMLGGARVGRAAPRARAPAARGPASSWRDAASPGSAGCVTSAHRPASTQLGDRHALGVEREVVERRDRPSSTLKCSPMRAARAASSTSISWRASVLVVGLEALHQALHAQRPSARTPARRGCAARARSSSVAPQPRISTLPFTARS